MNKSYGFKGMVVLALLAVLAMTTGCAADRIVSGTSISAEEMASFSKGKTTEEELLRKYGNPDQTLKLNAHTKEISYIKETIVGGYEAHSDKKVETWFRISHGVVQDFGQRDTNKSPNYGLK